MKKLTLLLLSLMALFATEALAQVTSVGVPIKDAGLVVDGRKFLIHNVSSNTNVAGYLYEDGEALLITNNADMG